jgi:hypothetical protein
MLLASVATFELLVPLTELDITTREQILSAPSFTELDPSTPRPEEGAVEMMVEAIAERWEHGKALIWPGRYKKKRQR